MGRSIGALVLSLLIHALVLLFFLLLLREHRQETPVASAKRVQLNLNQFMPPKPAARPAPSPPKPPAAKPQPKNRPVAPPKPPVKPTLKPSETKPEKPIVKRQKTQPVTKPTAKPLPRPKPAPSPAAKPVVPEPKPEPTPQSTLAKALGRPIRKTPPMPTTPQIDASFNRLDYRALYKDEFDTFSLNQQQFIKTNLSTIQQITQKYLTLRGYPYFAAQMRQQGMNIVEFYLYPNGDIDQLGIITPSGFTALDDNSIETIKTAYKDYPKPKERTKIRFYIYYRIY